MRRPSAGKSDGNVLAGCELYRLLGTNTDDPEIGTDVPARGDDGGYVFGIGHGRFLMARRARAKTSFSIWSVSSPVEVFCWLGWYELISIG